MSIGGPYAFQRNRGHSARVLYRTSQYKGQTRKPEAAARYNYTYSLTFEFWIKELLDLPPVGLNPWMTENINWRNQDRIRISVGQNYFHGIFLFENLGLNHLDNPPGVILPAEFSSKVYRPATMKTNVVRMETYDPYVLDMGNVQFRSARADCFTLVGPRRIMVVVLPPALIRREPPMAVYDSIARRIDKGLGENDMDEVLRVAVESEKDNPDAFVFAPVPDFVKPVRGGHGNYINGSKSPVWASDPMRNTRLINTLVERTHKEHERREQEKQRAAEDMKRLRSIRSVPWKPLVCQKIMKDAPTTSLHRTFCGKETLPGKSYCLEHYQQMYQKNTYDPKVVKTVEVTNA